ncbi:AAA family ATPase [Roseibium sp.]|uniref:AAA family ATPase n=1 Tax=Roseibium sp. TaxID=1936156 RepID=UPI003BB02610
MKRGFMLGKFMPPHNGHLFVCDVALRHVDQLTVLVCSNDAEPIDGCLRADWMGRCLNRPGVRVVHMHRDIPQEPKDHPNFWAIWQAACREHHPEPIDWVFGSEPYIVQLADVLAAKPFQVDPDRSIVPVSATQIRHAAHRHWKHVPGPVRTYYQKRITLLGPESSGKTTLSDSLAKQFGTLAIPEYGRAYDAIFRQGSGWTEADFLNIANGHLAFADAIAERAGPLVFEDTDLLQTVVWAEALLGGVPEPVANLLKTRASRQHYLLLGPEMGWVDDGTRYHVGHDQRLWFLNRLRHWLQKVGAHWTPVTAANWHGRTQEAIAAVEIICAGSRQT